MTQFKVDFNDFKRRDNTNLMEITLYKDNGEQIIPNRDHQWSGKALKFGDGDKRLDQELAVTLDGDKIGVPSKQLENLPSGDYGLELWEVSNDSKTIYPSAGFVEFHIHRNADESLESVTPTIDIDKVIDDLHQAGLNVVVDDIEMLAPDATPSVTSEVRDGKNYIKLHVPRGLTGNVGPAPTLTIGTVTKLNPDQTPTANISGDNGAYTLDLGIPQGVQGETDATATQALNVANSVDSKVTEIQSNGGGRNLAIGTDQEYTMGYGIPNTVWQDGYAYEKLPTTIIDIEIVPQDPHIFYYTLTKGTTYTQTIWFETNATVKDLSAVQITWYTNGAGHDFQPATIINLGENKYKIYSTYTWPGKIDNDVRFFDIYYLNSAFDLSTGTYLKFGKLMLENGTVSHDWSPAPEDAPSNDSQLVHKTNNETIAGDKAFLGNTTLATTTMLAGNYGLRVTSSGFQKTTDGITWVPANI